MLIVELNEFNVELLSHACQLHNLKQIKRILELKHCRTKSVDKVEHSGLDPWVQWVSIHSGLTSEQHGILRLGDIPELNNKQIWEVLSDDGITTGCWGLMNASRGKAENCLFFLPDPWSFSEVAFPSHLNSLLSLPRYYSKNYLDLSVTIFFKKLLRLAFYQLRSPTLWPLIKELSLIFQIVFKSRLKGYGLFLLFDLIATLHFIRLCQHHSPKVKMIFLNSIAHCQHHYWTKESIESGPMKLCLMVIDRVFKLLFNVFSDEEVIVLNALSQVQPDPEQPKILYRQINPEKFLTSTGLSFTKIEQLMTNDAHVFFDSENERDKAYCALKEVTIADRRLFDVHKDLVNPRKLFYQVAFWEKLSHNVDVLINQKQISFFEFFEAVVQRTGNHIPEGDIFYAGASFPKEIYNYEFFNYIKDMYKQ